MKKSGKAFAVCLLAAVLIGCGTLLSERKTLGNQLIRLHIVANSDSQEDQEEKLQVRDAVTAYVQSFMDSGLSAEDAKAWLQGQLPKLQEIANGILQESGRQATVTLEKEAFPVREYETFSLPSGVYESLRICIGQAKGHNWWCVVFPELCIPATSDGFADTAAGAGFSDSLSKTLSRESGYEIRFFFLDWLGKLENLFYRG